MFDGDSNAVIVPDSTTDGNFTDTFSVNFWMRREKPSRTTFSPSEDRHAHWRKEHILCLSDDHRMFLFVFSTTCEILRFFCFIQNHKKVDSKINTNNQFLPSHTISSLFPAPPPHHVITYCSLLSKNVVS